MKTIRSFRSRKSMQGLSLIELMIAMTLGLVVLGALVSVFANTSASRQELERTSRQIENGRFAMEILADEIRHAGFYGEANVKGIDPTGSLLSLNGTAAHLCYTQPTSLITAMPIHIQGFDEGQWLPWCFAEPIVPRTDVIVIRRVATCEAGVGDCPPPEAENAYIQVSKCATETASRPYMFGVYGSTTFNLTERDCATPAKLRKYVLRLYYISPDNGRGETIPTLKRLEWAGTEFKVVPMVEGIEDMQFEYGLDTTSTGFPGARPLSGLM
jgi:type IV pilus assembly protein PilW